MRPGSQCLSVSVEKSGTEFAGLQSEELLTF